MNDVKVNNEEFVWVVDPLQDMLGASEIKSGCFLRCPKFCFIEWNLL